MFLIWAAEMGSYAYGSNVEVFDHKRVAQMEITMPNVPTGMAFDSQAVLAKMRTKIGDPFSQVTFDVDLKMLADEYDRVEPALEVCQGEVILKIKVWAKPKIRSIEWTGNHFVDTRTLRKELNIRKGTILDRQKFNKAFNKVKEYYIKKGYFESQLEYRTVIDVKTYEVDVFVDIHEGRPGIIDDILFEGFTKQERSELLLRIYTKKYNLLLSWLTDRGIFHEDAVEHDKLTIAEFLQNYGYADAKVSIRIEEATSPGKIVLVIVAQRGPLYHFGDVTFDGNLLFTNAQVESLFLIHPDDVYSPEKMRQTALAIKELYGRKGYIEAIVDYDIRLDKNSPLYNVHFTIDEGQPYKVGIIRILGNTQTEDAVILRESLLVPGEIFDAAKLKATQEKLENIGYFKHVNVYAVRTQDDAALGANYRDVFIQVEEMTTGSISAFAGFSTSEDIFGGLELMEKNFNYRGLGKMFKQGLSALRGGGEYLQLRANFGNKQQAYTLTWMTPYLRDTLWRAGFELEYTYSAIQSDDLSIYTYGGNIFASYPVTNLWTFGTRYRTRNSYNHLRGHPPSKEVTAAHVQGIISALSVSMNFDSSDSMTKPKRGFRSFIETEYAGLAGDFYFLKMAYVNSLYTPLWPRGTMKYRWDFRWIFPMFSTSRPTKIPMSERFFIGGEGTVRGYRPFHIGPKFSNGDPQGGVSSAVLSLEYSHSILPIFDGFLFTDAGTVTMDTWILKAFRLSYGFGARLEVMNRVPIVLGMGFPVNPHGKEEVQKFFISMGGQF